MTNVTLINKCVVAVAQEVRSLCSYNLNSLFIRKNCIPQRFSYAILSFPVNPARFRFLLMGLDWSYYVSLLRMKYEIKSQVFLISCRRTSTCYHGLFCSFVLSFIKTIGKKIFASTDEPKSTSYLIQRISLAVQRGNAVSIIGTIPSSRSLDEVFYLL
jgi:hypothetical protein